MQKSEQTLKDLWNTTKQTDICIVEAPEGEGKREKTVERIFEEIMAENVPNLMKDMNINIQEAQEMSSRMNLKKSMPRHIIIKLSTAKDIEF